MDTYGYLWIPMDTYGYLWIPCELYGDVIAGVWRPVRPEVVLGGVVQEAAWSVPIECAQAGAYVCVFEGG
jgi:hypothetical protein